MNRATGLLIIEVVNSNPNGNPDQESDPRLRPDERGMISSVSFKRKLRDLVDETNGPIWIEKATLFSPALRPEEFQILESRGRDRQQIKNSLRTSSRKIIGTGGSLGTRFLKKGLPPRFALEWCSLGWVFQSARC